MKFNEIFTKLESGYPVTRKSWSNTFVYKMLPSRIATDIIPKMTSVPDKVKEVLVPINKDLCFTNQMCIVYLDTMRIDTYSPNNDDLYTDDWEVFTL